MIPGIDPKIDYAFKRVFGVQQNREILIDLLNAVLEPPTGQRIVEIQLLNPFNPKEFEKDKLSIVDVKARDQSGRKFVIEMQVQVHRDLPKRILYYWASLFSREVNEGEGFIELQPAVVICFVCEPLFAAASQYHLRFRLRDEVAGVVFSDAIEVHTIELSKFDRLPPDCRSLLDQWTYFLQHAEQLDLENLPDPLRSHPLIQQAMKELVMISQNPQERMEYLARRMKIYDERGIQRDAEEKGIVIGQIMTIQRMLRLPVTERTELSKHPLDDLLVMFRKLESQAFEQGS